MEISDKSRQKLEAMLGVAGKELVDAINIIHECLLECGTPEDDEVLFATQSADAELPI